MKNIKHVVAGVLVVMVAGAMPMVAHAARFGGGDAFTVNQNEVVEGDLYAAGGSITVAGTVAGDMVAAGGTVIITGRVVQDVIVAGGTVNISGEVGDDVRVGGGNVSITGTVGGDLIVAGGQATILPGTVVNGDLIVMGGQMLVNGTVNGNVRALGESLILDGTVRGEVNAKGTEITIGRTANIRGGLTYASSRQANISEDASIGGDVVFTQLSKRGGAARGAAFGGILVGVLAGWFFLKLLLIFVGALLLALIFRSHSRAVVRHAMGEFWGDVGRGFVVLVVVPVATVILAITVVGLPLAGILLLAYLLLLGLAKFGAVMVVGAWLDKVLFKRADGEIRWTTVLVGTIGAGLLSLVPFVGWIVQFALFLVALGALASVWHERVWKNR